MIEQVAIAFERKDYQTAAKLLKHLLKESPDNPAVQLYVGKLHEVSGKREQAKKVYRQLLKSTANQKILTQARQGLQRIEQIEQQEKHWAIAQATANPEDTELGVLILEPISNELKTQLVSKFAEIMQLEPYNARLMLPTRSWRFYRTGRIGELLFYVQQMQQVGIPCFCTKISAVEKIEVFQVKYFSESEAKATVICCNEQDQLGSLTFDWSEVSARVMGVLPIFGEVVALNSHYQIERKLQAQDYVQFCDLHLLERRCILRLHDQNYQFQQGVEISPSTSQNTMRINWNHLLDWLNQYLPQVKIWSDFMPFAEAVFEQKEMLENIQSHIHLFRRQETDWDSAFHLYSSLIFLRQVPKT